MVDTPTIVVLTQPADPHADRVVEALQKHGADVFRFNPADFPLRARMSVRVRDGDPRGSLFAATEGMRLESVDTVWYRRPEAPELPAWPAVVRKFATKEVQHALGGMWASLDCLWVSHPHLIARAEFKMSQLKWARECGFCVPDTLISNEPHEARAFIAEHSGCTVYKVLTVGQLPYDANTVGAIYTTPVAARHVDAIERVSVCPCLLQEYVPKRVEVRATVFGSKVLAVEIDSQAFEQTRHDWRRYHRDMTYRPHQLDSAIEQACIDLVQKLGLHFGAIDLIVTPSGEYVFLEINPNGQWGWLEDETQLPFTPTLVELLCHEQE